MVLTSLLAREYTVHDLIASALTIVLDCADSLWTSESAQSIEES